MKKIKRNRRKARALRVEGDDLSYLLPDDADVLGTGIVEPEDDDIREVDHIFTDEDDDANCMTV